MRRARTLTILAAAAATAAGGGAAAEGSVLVGVELDLDATQSICPAGAPCTYMQTLGGVPTMTSPIDGVITAWRVKSGGQGGDATLRVVHAFAGGRYLARTPGSATETPAAGVNAFPARVRIAKGDAIALDNSTGSALFAAAGEAVYVFDPALRQFTAAKPFVTAASVPRRLLLNATVEPDADGDGYGDETQDGCADDRSRQAAPCAAPFAVTGVAFGPTVLRKSPPPRGGGLGFGVTFKASRPTRVRLVVQSLQPGRKFAGVCVPAAFSPGGPRCAVTHVVRDIRASVSSFGPLVVHGFSLDARRLPVGLYRAILTVADRLSPATFTRMFVVRILR